MTGPHLTLMWLADIVLWGCLVIAWAVYALRKRR